MRSVFDASLVKDINFPEDASHWVRFKPHVL